MAEASTGVSRQDLLAAALRVLRDEGPAALRVRRVAAEAGCSTMGVYTWFGGKNGLVEALWLDGLRGMGAALAAVPAGRASLGRLRRLACAYRDWALANPTQYQLMFGRAVPEFQAAPEALEEAYATFALVVEAVAAAQSAGLVRKGAPGQLALYLWGLTHGLVMIEIAGVTPPPAAGDPDRSFHRAVDALLAGIAA